MKPCVGYSRPKVVLSQPDCTRTRVQAWAKARPQVRMVEASGTPDEVLARIEAALA